MIIELVRTVGTFLEEDNVAALHLLQSLRRAEHRFSGENHEQLLGIAMEVVGCAVLPRIEQTHVEVQILGVYPLAAPRRVGQDAELVNLAGVLLELPFGFFDDYSHDDL